MIGMTLSFRCGREIDVADLAFRLSLRNDMIDDISDNDAK
jgi:hypothetical protein